MKLQRLWIALAAAAVLASTAACSQPGPGYGPGYGPGMMGGGYGYGPGMMGGGYGPGPGYGGGYGPGMMGGGYGGGYGPGMMGGWGRGGWGLADLTDDQRKRIGEAEQDFWKKQWPLMQAMHAAMWNAEGEPGAAFDEQAARKNYDAVAGLRKQMFDNMLDMRKRVDAVLTPQQREQLRRGGSR